MRRSALALFMLVGLAARGQAPNDTSGVEETVDRASAYYHYTLAHMYAEMAAATGGRNARYVNNAIENYKAAIKADPRMPIRSEDLAAIYLKRPKPPLPSPPPPHPTPR